MERMEREKLQISRCWHPDPITTTNIRSSTIAVRVGKAAYQLTDGTIIEI